MIESLSEKLRSGEATVAGVLSGTSADGIDVALVRFARGEGARLGTPQLLEFTTVPFPSDLGQRVRRVLDGSPLGLRESALLSRDLGRAFGASARELARRTGRPLDLVGSHGQTVYHHDGREPTGAATLQLGDGDFVAEGAGCAVVSDFRQRDIAAGGEGAPISALADDLIFAELPRPSAILNLGGFGNLTVLGEESLLSFDTGPANALLDGLARRLLDRPFDEGGQVARAGACDSRLVDELFGDPFFERPPPRSTGRDSFGEAWIDRVVDRARALGVLADPRRPENLLATAADFVALSVVRALERYCGDVHWVVVCGGGVHHARVLDTLALRSRAPIASGQDFGVDPDAREALVFAVLAARCILGEATTSPSATGAQPGRVLGKLSPHVELRRAVGSAR
jgi:anhydro-N-acetylmuramic acid kinase